MTTVYPNAGSPRVRRSLRASPSSHEPHGARVKRPLFRRLLAVTGSAALGLMGAVALASPAQAHHTTISGVAQCTPNEWVITWTVENWETDMTATIDVTADPNTPITNIVDGATLP